MVSLQYARDQMVFSQNLDAEVLILLAQNVSLFRKSVTDITDIIS